MTNHKQTQSQSQSQSQTVAIVIRILFFLIPFGIIGLISLASGKSYTNSMADFTLYKRYFAAGLLALFLILAIIFATKEYEEYRTTKNQHALSLAKVSTIAATVISLFLILQLIFIHFLRQTSTQTRARIEGFNRTANGVKTAFDIFRMK